ncbi:NAD(P)-dependent alcohol dehydrogenase [Ulvibacterium sp.]|uniref:NAD(P)-dependent alcohol dehydrogenase n=1 Tax=Ulvibacterium sp. TaxID=2665914 RepID=UPI0026134284|nr:NAD(P)-dependent alcohol dehydrogenase [Ulvibacterium sp.]
MKAAVRRSYGPPESIVIEDVEKPIPKDNEVLVRVKATTVNRTDCANLRAVPFVMRFVLGFRKPKKIILGTDFAGDVVAIGKDVKSFHIGDRVFGFDDIGVQSQAEYLVLPENGSLFPIPDSIGYKPAAAGLEGAHYAYTFVHKVSIQSGHSILINGATGAIGSALIQFVRQYNVHLTATCNTKNMELVKSLGADKIYDYTREDFTKDTEKYDFVFDAVGKSTFGKCRPMLKRGGVYISSELGPYAQNVGFALLTPILGKKKVIFPIPYPTPETIPYIMDRLTTKKFSPVIDREYPLQEISQAYTYVLTGEKTGNVIITL